MEETQATPARSAACGVQLDERVPLERRQEAGKVEQSMEKMYVASGTAERVAKDDEVVVLWRHLDRSN